MKYHYKIIKKKKHVYKHMDKYINIHSDSSELMTRDEETGIPIKFAGFNLKDAAENAGKLIRDFLGLNPDKWDVEIYEVEGENNIEKKDDNELVSEPVVYDEDYDMSTEYYDAND